MKHQLMYDPPSAASLNCLVSPSPRELKPYPQSSLYNLCLVVPSPAVHSTSLHPRRSDHHYSWHGKQHCIPPCHCWSILRYHSSLNYCGSGSLDLYTSERLFAVLIQLSHHVTSLLLATLTHWCRRTLLILAGTNLCTTL